MLFKDHPLYKEVHPLLNEEMNLETLTIGSSKEIWWQCSKGHEWSNQIRYRTRTGRTNTCPACRYKRSTVEKQPLSTTHPVLTAFLKDPKLGLTLSKGSNKKVSWVCSQNHEWVSTPHAQEKETVKCPTCARAKKVKPLETTHPELAEQLKTRSLASTLSKGSSTKAWWVCENKHEWEASVKNRVNGRGCPYCSRRKTLEGVTDFSTLYPEKATLIHPTRNILNVRTLPSSSETKVWWLGNCGHEWEATVVGTVQGAGCIYCFGKRLLVGENDLKTKHPDLIAEWDYKKNVNIKPDTVLPGSMLKVWWKCSKEHSWKTTINHRTGGNNCPECSYNAYSSKGEEELRDYVISLVGIDSVETNTRKVLGNRELDIYIPEKKLAIEYNGLYWHSEHAGKDKKYHYNKWLACKEQGIQLIQIWEDDWRDSSHVVKNMLAHKLLLSEKTKIFARRTNIGVVSNSEAFKFLDENHIQKTSDGSIRIGLLTEEKTLVALMILKQETRNGNTVLNLVRYATSHNVVGGFTKLLKHVLRTYNPEMVITFSDNCISDGNLYALNGFTLDKELPPDYSYLVKGKREHKFNYRLKKFRSDSNLKYQEGLSESQLADINNLPRIWDSGKMRWVLKK